jgi:hypothetical protein
MQAPIDSCPYGALDCPKIESVKKVLDENSKQIEEININVVKLTTTIRNASFVIGIIVTILAAIIGADLL